MSDQAADHFKVEGSDASTPKFTSVSLTITLQATGQLEYSFPANELLSYGLLEKARAKLDELAMVATVKQAQASRGGMLGLLKRRNGG